ncbi:hypothetical protein SDJN02_07928, partial [Cucurbita argyrosperma subsp. argyrosperma]
MYLQKVFFIYHSMTSPNCVPESLECNYSKLQHRVMSINPIGLSCQERINQEDSSQSSYFSSDGNSCMTTKINGSSVGCSVDNADGISAFAAPSNMKPLFSYVDKSVMECQMSKTIVYDKEINVNDVKDICIDEGVTSLDNYFFRSKDEKSICKIVPLEKDQTKGSVKEQENSSEMSKSTADDRKVSLEDHFAMDWTTHNDAKETKFNPSEPKVSMHISSQKLVKKGYSSESFDNMGVQISGEKEKSDDPDSASKSVESCNSNSALRSTAEPPKDVNRTHQSAYNNESENGSIAFNFNSISPVANGAEEHHGNTNLNYPAPITSSAVTQEWRGSDSGTQVSTNLECRTSDSRQISSQSTYDIGESSFSAADPLASLITYSGPGSVSLRSESSTTSTRSFAFPILQSEWNSSPVKMVKAERRHYRKYRGWREGLLCCRF